MRCILNLNTDPYFNLAAEEYVLKNFRDDIFMLWRNDNAVIVGRYQNSAAEINYDFVREHQVKVVRRMTGGGAVFHDLGNVNFTFVAANGQGDFRSFTEPILQLLNKMGVPARFEGRNDLMIEGQKFSGNAQCVYRGKILHHGTLLFASEMEDLSGALKVNPLKFKDKSVKSVRKRVTNISEHLPHPMSVEEFMAAVMTFVSAQKGALPYSFSQDDVAAIQQLANEKYNTWEWNFGVSPKCDYAKMIRTAGGNLEVNLSISDGKIVKVKIFGDFFSQKDLSELELLLVGVAYREDAVRALLAKIEIDRYLCNVTVDDMVEVMF